MAAAAAAAHTGCPVAVVAIGGALADSNEEWVAIRGTTNGGAVLVRPDRHVAWRSDPADRTEALTVAIQVLLDGAASVSDGNRDSLLEGIHSAAEALVG